MIDLAARAAASLEGFDDLHRLRVGDFAKDDVLTVEPAGDDGGDEKLGTVTI